MQDDRANRPLSGIRVIDFGQYIAGPAFGMILADQGAEVIRVDPPHGSLRGSHGGQRASATVTIFYGVFADLVYAG